MDPGENPNLTSPREGTLNPNPQSTNINKETDERMRSLRTLVQKLLITRDLS